MFYKYPSIENFQNFIKTYKGKKQFDGLDENNQPIFKDRVFNEIELTGTVKLHGTNAAVNVFPDGSIYIQKRSASMPLDITKGNAHFSFMQFVYDNQEWFKKARKTVVEVYGNQFENSPITFFGEWCGPGIQKGVGISQIDKKRFFIFGIQEQISNKWFQLSQIPYNDYTECIWYIAMFGTYTLRANFNDAVTLLEQLDSITLSVENECPVAKEFGVSGIGEGVVWSGYDKDVNFIQFKHKGDKHQNPGKKTPKIKTDKDIIDNSKIQKFISTVDIVNRLKQCYHELYENQVPSKRETGPVINWVSADIIKEEYHLMKELGIDVADIKTDLSRTIRELFFEDIDNSL